MGSANPFSRPKRSGLEVRKYLNPPYGELEEEVKDAILTGGTQDRVLDYLIGLTITSLAENRPLFANPIEEPVFYQEYFRRWVKEGVDEVQSIEQREKELAQKVQGSE